MLNPDQVASQGPGGFLNLNGGPTDPYYALSDGTGYASAAAACAAVPTAARRNRTVNVAGVDYWWLQSDLSDNGLVLKTAASNGGGTGVPAQYAEFTFPVEVSGAQSFPLPTGTLGIDGPLQVYQGDNGLVRTILTAHYRLSGGNLVIDTEASLLTNDTVAGRRFYGGTPGGAGGRDYNNVPQSVRDAVRAAGHTWSAGDLLSYASPAQQTAATTGVVKSDYFDAYEAGNQTSAYRYTYCLQNDGSLGWTRIPKAI